MTKRKSIKRTTEAEKRAEYGGKYPRHDGIGWRESWACQDHEGCTDMTKGKGEPQTLTLEAIWLK